MKNNLIEGLVINIKRIKILLQNNFWSRFHYDKKIYSMVPYFKDKIGVRIGGKLGWKFEKFIKNTNKIIDVNISKDYLGKNNKIDYLTDATNLYFAKDNEFDFVCSSHVLEHLSNPIKALKEWIRVIKKEGIIYCGIPDKRFIFDYKRERTSLKHLIKDYKKNIKGHDNTHINDLANNLGESKCVYNKKRFIENLKTNPLIYTHYHVWTKEDIIELFGYVKLEVIFVDVVGNTIHIVGRKNF